MEGESAFGQGCVESATDAKVSEVLHELAPEIGGRLDRKAVGFAGRVLRRLVSSVLEFARKKAGAKKALMLRDAIPTLIEYPPECPLFVRVICGTKGWRVANEIVNQRLESTVEVEEFGALIGLSLAQFLRSVMFGALARFVVTLGVLVELLDEEEKIGENVMEMALALWFESEELAAEFLA